MAWAPATIACPYCFASLPANARFCGNCGRPIRISALLPRITHPPRLEEALAAFQQTYPTYASTAALDDLRAREYARLDQQRHVYLDYTGGGLYAESQLRDHMALLTSHVLVDCAAFVPTNRLDLSRWHPDFVPLSFYKIFGYPTGVGCLLARKPALAKLRRPWYAGGTITLSSVLAADDTGAGFYLTPGAPGFEDGTVNYLNIPAVEIGLKHIASIGIEMIHERVTCLTGWLLEQLATLRHRNGARVVQIYGPRSTQQRGGTIAFNFFNPQGKLLDCYQTQEKTNQLTISIRSGCFCNPGVREIALGFEQETLANCFRGKDEMTYEQFLHLIDGQKTGALRVSLGLASNFADVYRFMQFAQTFVDRAA